MLSGSEVPTSKRAVLCSSSGSKWALKSSARVIFFPPSSPVTVTTFPTTGTVSRRARSVMRLRIISTSESPAKARAAFSVAKGASWVPLPVSSLPSALMKSSITRLFVLCFWVPSAELRLPEELPPVISPALFVREASWDFFSPEPPACVPSAEDSFSADSLSLLSSDWASFFSPRAGFSCFC